MANENTPQQIVISGPKKEIEKARAVFENTKDVKLFHPLNVSGAFHSRYMNEAKQVFKQYIDSFQFAPLAIDQILGYSIEKLCTEKSYLDVNHTEYTQPALYVVNALSYLKRVEETGRKPDFAAGHSLGEYNALMAAGAFDFETGLRLVKKRGELMGRITGGGMAAVIDQNLFKNRQYRLYRA